MPTVKRVMDASIASCALIAVSPVLLIAAVGIKWSSPGPIFFRARRIARDRRRIGTMSRPAGLRAERRQAAYLGREFTIYKFRTMRVSADGQAAPITAWKDSRIFPFGEWLRSTKIDELPQLLNVIKGEMALVGPRPEAPEIVRRHYTEEDLDTLQVLPGLTSPGTLYYYTHCEEMLAGDAAGEIYVQSLLPLKLALDRVYIKNATLLYDVQLIFRTIAVIVARVFGTHQFPDPPELAEAEASVSILPRDPWPLSAP
jgi:lipopolysaccharide/colanic/teichoic acid biosynthesis glycosyltransferase